MPSLHEPHNEADDIVCLDMQCWTEELSEVQKKIREKLLKECETAKLELAKFIKKSNVAPIYQGDSVLGYCINESIAPPPPPNNAYVPIQPAPTLPPIMVAVLNGIAPPPPPPPPNDAYIPIQPAPTLPPIIHHNGPPPSLPLPQEPSALPLQPGIVNASQQPYQMFVKPSMGFKITPQATLITTPSATRQPTTVMTAVQPAVVTTTGASTVVSSSTARTPLTSGGTMTVRQLPPPPQLQQAAPPSRVLQQAVPSVRMPQQAMTPVRMPQQNVPPVRGQQQPLMRTALTRPPQTMLPKTPVLKTFQQLAPLMKNILQNPNLPPQSPHPPPNNTLQPANNVLKPSECTSVGGLTVDKSSASSEVVESIDLTEGDDSTSDKNTSTVADSREVTFNKLQGKTYPSLVVVARPGLRTRDVPPNVNDRSELDARVKSILVMTPTKFTEYLIQQGLVKAEQHCNVHIRNKLKLGMYSDVSKFQHSGGYVWISECCAQRFISVFYGSMFEGSPHPPTVTLKLIYHWACQTNIQNVMQWVKVDSVFVKVTYTWLRAICTMTLAENTALLGGIGKQVQIGVISLGTTSTDGSQKQVKVEVLGAYDPDSKLLKLRAIEPLYDEEFSYKRRFAKILEPLAEWVDPHSTILTDMTVDKSTLILMGYFNVVQNMKNNVIIMDYLRKVVPRMFQNTLSLLSRQIIQQFLDELVWRESFGMTPAQAFNNILINIADQTKKSTPLEGLVTRLNKIASNPFTEKSPAASPPPLTRGTVNEKVNDNRDELSDGAMDVDINQSNALIPSANLSESPEEEYISNVQATRKLSTASTRLMPATEHELKGAFRLEQMYCGTLAASRHIQKTKITIKCGLCLQKFVDNISTMRHVFRHVYGFHDSVQCEYCLTFFGSASGLHAHHIKAHKKEIAPGGSSILNCLICGRRTLSDEKMIQHFVEEHVLKELPYMCQACNFRTSNHRHAIDHFYEEHAGTTFVQCPFCLLCKDLQKPDAYAEFHTHIKKHQNARDTLSHFACIYCQLTFIDSDEFRVHLYAMHKSLTMNKHVVPWMPAKGSRAIFVIEARTSRFSNALCMECRSCAAEPHHFNRQFQCDKCTYMTFCPGAAQSHICGKYEKINCAELSKPMFCTCGFREMDGNKMALHLVQCQKATAYYDSQVTTGGDTSHDMLGVLGLYRSKDGL